MHLRRALMLHPNALVAFTGGGGKTTAMFRLAGEIVAGGGRAVVTTTTRIFAAQLGLSPAHVLAGADGWRAAAEAALAQHGQVLVSGPVDEATGKAHGVEPTTLAALRDLAGAPAILMEADGSRMRPFKAPADHEPVIPPETTLVVPVVGADVFGAALGPERVHRPELVAALGEWTMGAPVTPELVARILLHPAGGLKGVPAGAQVIPLINKAEAGEALAAARETAARLLAAPRIETVILGAVRTDEPAREAWGRVGAVVLAAGRSSRMGRPKPTLAWREGQTLLGAVVARLRTSPVHEIVVVTGLARDAVAASLEVFRDVPGPPVRLAHNPDFETTEMARSLQIGLNALSPGIQAAVVALADQPEVDPAVIEAVIQRWRETRAAAVAPFYQGQRGHPLLFDRAAWPALHALPGSANPREALAALGGVVRVDSGSAAPLRDIDTPDDYAQAKQP